MNSNFLENLENSIQKTIQNNINKKTINIEEIKKKEITNEEIELAQKLDAIQEFSIDRFEGNIAVIENKETGETMNIEKEKIPNECKEGDIIKCINGKFFFDEEKTLEAEKEIKDNFNDLWK